MAPIGQASSASCPSGRASLRRSPGADGSPQRRAFGPVPRTGSSALSPSRASPLPSQRSPVARIAGSPGGPLSQGALPGTLRTFRPALEQNAAARAAAAAGGGGSPSPPQRRSRPSRSPSMMRCSSPRTSTAAPTPLRRGGPGSTSASASNLGTAHSAAAPPGGLGNTSSCSSLASRRSHSSGPSARSSSARLAAPAGSFQAAAVPGSVGVPTPVRRRERSKPIATELHSSSELLPVATVVPSRSEPRLLQSSFDAVATPQPPQPPSQPPRALPVACPVTGCSVVSSSSSTRTPSPYVTSMHPGRSIGGQVAPVAQCLSDVNASLAERLLQAERSLLDKDRQIEALELQVRDTTLGSSSGSDAGGTSITCSTCATCAAGAAASANAAWSVEQSTVLEEVSEELDHVVGKSEDLIRKMSDLNVSEEPERQWAALMAAHEDCKERLSQIETLVQRRVEQLPAGDSELRVCRAVRGLCVGAQRVVPRRWALAG
eukprot:TRINITY_DN29035_c0_g1_i2.p1 TRINITY_DN29035_c0_g1~~TRINITY_DN29035_c0_g1_i2.p1  ORF type:complete len:490 (+),score=65.77 TRINITY_DN29035_c0_g1_i2:148-1617(+)